MPYKWFTPEEIAQWPPGHKRCRGCDRVLPLHAFNVQAGTLYGRTTQCQDCRRPKSKADHQAALAKGTAFNLWSRAKRRAAAKGVPFSITVEDVVVPDVCPVLGHALQVGDRDWAPSLDRTIPIMGYVPGNVVVMSARANTLKSNASAAELRAVADYVAGACEV